MPSEGTSGDEGSRIKPTVELSYFRARGHVNVNSPQVKAECNGACHSVMLGDLGPGTGALICPSGQTHTMSLLSIRSLTQDSISQDFKTHTLLIPSVILSLSQDSSSPHGGPG